MVRKQHEKRKGMKLKQEKRFEDCIHGMTLRMP